MHKMVNEQTVRINFEVTRDLHARMAKAFPYGLRGKVMTALLEALVNGVESHGQLVLGAVLDGQFVLRYQPKQQGGKDAA